LQVCCQRQQVLRYDCLSAVLYQRHVDWHHDVSADCCKKFNDSNLAACCSVQFLQGGPTEQRILFDSGLRNCNRRRNLHVLLVRQSSGREGTKMDFIIFVDIQGVFEMRAEILTTIYWLHVELGKNI
jgi:hypothetical protein